jgi:radical SAM superfamily enzyme YgiQ (UPF0313 family)
MRLFLISANLETKPACVYPLGVTRLASALRAQGHEVEIFDLLVHGDELLESCLAAFRPDLVGISLRNVDNTESHDTQAYLPAYQRLMQRLRQATDAPIVIGGPAYSIFPSALLDYLEADFGVPGPGEAVLQSVAAAWDAGRPYLTLPGLMVRSQGQVHSTGCGPAGFYPGPITREPELVQYYWSKGGSLNVQTRLGCTHQCVFCTYPQIDGPGTTTVSARAVAEEILDLHQALGVNHVFFTDSVFNLEPEHALAVADALIQKQSPVTWTCFCEPGELPQGFLARLAQAGCTHIEFGTDSLSDPVLEAYGKPFRREDIRRWSQAAAEAKIHQAHFLILGGPGETQESIAETFAFSHGLRPAAFFPYLGMRIFPGTPLHQRALAEGRVTPDQLLLDPAFYFSNATSEEWLVRQVEEQALRDPRWVTPEKWKQAESVTQRLRLKGKKGPLWEYLAG